MNDVGAPVLELRDLRVSFTGGRPVHAVRGLDLSVRAGEVLAVVGESGSGKSVSMLATMGLLPAHASVTGSAMFLGQDLLTRRERELRAIRGAGIAMVFQDPMRSLNPVLTIGFQVAEAIRLHQKVSKRNALARAVELLDLVGIAQPKERAEQYPHELSGGMRQRVMIAMAMANDPKVLIADEPTTALDVTIQAQVLELMSRLRRETGSAMVLITHDLGVVAEIADRVVVMYAGRACESGTVSEVLGGPRHPYALGLQRSMPDIEAPARSALAPIPGQPPDLADVPVGCAFRDRCEFAIDLCASELPTMVPVGSGHDVACHRRDEHLVLRGAA